jgi:hypothetical protein
MTERENKIKKKEDREREREENNRKMGRLNRLRTYTL